jgi:hypothetical protein
MEPQEQTQETITDPVDLIKYFEQGHIEAMRSAIAASSQPSHGTLEVAAAQVAEAAARLDPLVKNSFFKETGNDLAVLTAVSSVKTAVEEIIDCTHQVNPDWSARVEFDEDVVENWTKQIFEGEDDEASRGMVELANLYVSFAQNLESAVVGSASVQEFLKQDLENQKFKEKLILFGGVAAAAFVGTILAQRTTR